MVAATQSQPQPQAQPKQPPTPTAAAKPSPEEEALKRNTDCVYFLASPLTCKKGSECEYRHSEYARVNPRDCYYWLNGNCLNPKCGFRHPPLDGLLGTQMGAPPASVPSANMAVVPAPPVPYNSGAPPSKQAVPCIFFQKGLCLKGDRCAFSHGLNPTFNKTPQPTVSTSSVEPHMLKKDFGGLVKCSQPPKAAIGVPPEAKTVSTRNGAGTDKNLPISAGFGDDVPRYKVPTGPSVVNGSSIGRPNRLHHIADEQSFPTSKDTDEHLRESSPGFDVLVDDEHGDSDYYHGEDQYGRARAHEGRNINEYDTGRFGNFEAMADADREMYSDSLGYDSFDHVQGKYGWEQHGATSEGARGATHQERRSYSKSEGPDLFEESDLRYRLSKHRRVNGLRSVVSHDHARENHGEERNHWGSLRKDSQNMPPHESPVSSRFRGRIKLHTSSAADTQGEIDRARNWSSPGRPQFSSHQGRLRDRLKGRVDEEYNNKDGRNFRGPRMMDEQHSDFTGPKSLAELKSGKNADNKESQSLGKRKIMEGNPQNEGDLSFKGPLPFSEILKRKRQAEAAASGNGTSSVSENNNEKQSALSSDSKEKTFSKEEPKLTTGYATGIVEGKSDVAHGESAALPNASEHENENTMMEEEGVEDHELEGDGQGDGEYYYEEGEEGDYAYEEGENVEGDYTYEGGENVEGDYIYEEGENVEGEEHLECGE